MKLAIEQTTTLSLEQQLDRIVLESKFTDTLTDSFAEYIPGIYTKLSDLNASLTRDNKERDLKVMEKLNRLKLHGYKYEDLGPIADILIVSPYGLNTTLLEYLPPLTKIIKEVDNLVKESLADFNIYLSIFINDASSRSNLSDRAHKYNAIDKKRMQLLEALNSFYDSKRNQGKMPIRKLLDTLGQMNEVMDETVKVARLTSSVKLNDINDEVKKTVDLIKFIKELIDDGSLGEVGSTIAMNVSKEAYVVGSLIELLTVVRYRADMVVESVQALAKKTFVRT